MAVVTTNLGVVTAYGDAVEGGYTGTKEQWQALMADYGTIGAQAQADAQTASTAAQTATTKASEASASATQAQQAAASVSTPDTTLTQSGKAADAKATGDEISALKEGLNILRPSATSADVGKALIVKTVEDGAPTEFEYGETGGSFPVPSDEQEVTPTWERGTISTANGSNAQGDGKSARTNGYITCSKDKVTVVVDSSVTFSWRLYSATNAFLGTSDWLEGTQVLTVEIGQKLRFVCKNVDGTTLDVATVSGLVTIKEGEQQDVVGKIPTVKTVADGHVTEWEFSEAGSSIELDSTLTDATKAAQAKAVGDAINALSLGTNKYVWAQGGIANTSPGANSSASNRARTADYIGIVTNAKLTIPSDTNCSLRWYTSAKAFVSADSDWRTSGTYDLNALAPSTAVYVRIVIKFTNNRNVTASDLEYLHTNVTITEKYDLATKKDLDDAISPIDVDVSGLAEDVSALGAHMVTGTPSVAWEIGGINSNGTDYAITTRARSVGFITQFPGLTVVIPTGFECLFRWYAEDGSLAYADSDWRESGTYTPYAIYATDKLRIALRYPSDATVTSDTITYITNNVSIKYYADFSAYSTAKYDIAGNNVGGNLSVVAAKVINFSDGTKPYTDWYLLASQSGVYYRSKDLKTKERLFTFAPPYSSTTHSKWAVGIDGNNNVFFVLASSDLANSATALDDSARRNPVYFLASENYSTMHTLDFGTGLKPCGWLENVGWCVLPNNDIIMCEYTRPHVKTCNVWHVDGTDTTDPNNWTAVWSHDIITSEDPSVSGVKHCHYVAYDFYTDICYFGTGDSADGSCVYYSTDHGETWTLAWGPDRILCRSLNLIFTADKVYWGSDSWESQYHKFFIAERDENGIVDGANCTQIDLGQVHTQSCYGCVYLPSVGLIVMMDRNDQASSTQLTVQAYDLTTNQIVTLCEFGRVDDSIQLGFRCKYFDWYPVDNSIIVGFALAIRTNGTVEYNNFKALGNGTGAANRVNNMRLFIDRIGNGFDVRVDTIYV